MASAVTLFAYFMALVGIILVLAIIYYVYLKYYGQPVNKNNWPPPNYMKYIGARCPTGWRYIGADNNMDVCVNDLGIPIKEDSGDCYDPTGADGKVTNTKSFKAITDWPISQSAQKQTLADRCLWINKCGPKRGQYATWFGVSELC